ncbi:hypothetical protein SAMN05216359_11880 [Roseateles sp. YR242]|uniref:hypothetical protein n=1 Tax=Roseateles sp. YR242 TaxID=1855305 RepID=UPI0008CDCF8F|nr:hypothetical protein [Roseateles sp. YR242]SEL82913.1 hypothetical protein SAMN05216359_11880 [Roseateles sp. YR242]
MKDIQTTSWCRSFGRVIARSIGLSAKPSAAAHTQAFSTTRAPLETPPPAAPAVPVARAVPVQLNALREALDAKPALRARHAHLVLLEFACSTSSDDPFSRLPARTLDVAMRQLEVAARHSPTLDVLRLQLDRHLQQRRSRVEAVLAAGDAALDSPAVAPLDAQDRAAAMPPTWRDTVFMDTVPMDHEAQWLAEPASA